MKSGRKEGEGNVAFFMRNVGQASLAASIAEVITIPVDTAKVRLQIQTTPEGQIPKYRGVVQTVSLIAKEEGVASLFSGLTAALQRQMIFAGLRVGLYTPIRDMVTGPLPEGVNPSLGQKVIASLISGSIAITIANPTDLVKVKMQGQGVAMLKGEPKLYNGSMHCYSRLLAEGGIANLWTGWGPNLFRNSIINAAELASYDQLK